MILRCDDPSFHWAASIKSIYSTKPGAGSYTAAERYQHFDSKGYKQSIEVTRNLIEIITLPSILSLLHPGTCRSWLLIYDPGVFVHSLSLSPQHVSERTDF